MVLGIDNLNKYMESNYSHAINNAFKCKGYTPYKKINVEVSTNNLLDCTSKLEDCGINYMYFKFNPIECDANIVKDIVE